ncbi:hypothetical protein [Dyadobacter sp.]|uniref:hypothetical protein n=1 Tax=Dyadobacter sp. TaxID=1914288 RepID=UPI003F6F26E5
MKQHRERYDPAIDITSLRDLTSGDNLTFLPRLYPYGIWHSLDTPTFYRNYIPTGFDIGR